MKRFRFRSIRTRFAVLAIASLLWSQLVLAAHPLCSTAAMAMSDMTSTLVGAADDCHHEQAPSRDETLCLAHCSQGDQIKDVARVPAIPALPPVPPPTLVSLASLPADPVPHPGLPPPVSWHRPTAHPAALLLI